MSKKVSTCLYIDRGILETARSVGLNVSKVAENGLIDAIGRLTGTVPGTILQSRPPELVEARAGI
jgi:hypothetical protein